MTRALAAAVALLGACTQPPPPPAPVRPPAPTTPTTVATTTTAAVRAPSAPVRVPPPPEPVRADPAGAVAAQTARASWYARGARTANGERFDPDGLTYAHLTDAYGTMTRFCRGDTCVTARCNDRGPAKWTGRTFDLSRAAFAAIAPLGAGVVTVTWEAA